MDVKWTKAGAEVTAPSTAKFDALSLQVKPRVVQLETTGEASTAAEWTVELHLPGGDGHALVVPVASGTEADTSRFRADSERKAQTAALEAAIAWMARCFPSWLNAAIATGFDAAHDITASTRRPHEFIESDRGEPVEFRRESREVRRALDSVLKQLEAARASALVPSGS